MLPILPLRAHASSGKLLLDSPCVSRGSAVKHSIQRSGHAPARKRARQALWPAAAHSPAASTSEDWEKPPKTVNTARNEADDFEESEEDLNGFQRFWKRYNSLLNTRPVLVKSLTSLFGFMIGDILAQVIGGQPYNALRTLRLTLFGILMDGPVGHLWYTTLDKVVYPDKPTSKRAVISKMLCDQLLWAPAFTCVFFAFMCCLEGRPHKTMVSIQQKLGRVLLTNYAVWPLAHLVNFRFVPTSQRILYINACQILWSSFLSTCQARA